jgi:hypothetical protein
MQAQAQGGEVSLDSKAGIGQKDPIAREQGKIIDKPEVLLGVQGLFDEVIEPIEVDIGEKLAGEIADRETSGAF